MISKHVKIDIFIKIKAPLVKVTHQYVTVCRLNCCDFLTVVWLLYTMTHNIRPTPKQQFPKIIKYIIIRCSNVIVRKHKRKCYSNDPSPLKMHASIKLEEPNFHKTDNLLKKSPSTSASLPNIRTYKTTCKLTKYIQH